MEQSPAIPESPNVTITPAPPPSRKRWLSAIIAASLAIIFNIVTYVLIPKDFVQQVGDLGYLGVFLVTLVSNAAIILPVPYIGVVAAVAPGLSIFGVALAAAIGSVLGESVAFGVGRSGRAIVEDTRFYRWVQRQLTHPWRAFFVLFTLSAPPNPAFDVAGMAAGAMGLPYWMFASAVFLGRLIRFSLIAWLGILGAGGR